MTLQSPVTRLKGVGPAIEKGLRGLGIFTVGDLLNYYPRRWDSYNKVKSLATIKPGLVSLTAKVEKVHMRSSARRTRLKITEAILSDTTGTIRAVWFNQPYLAQSLLPGQTYHFRGNYEFKNNYVSLQAPTFTKPSEDDDSTIVTTYPESKQITSSILRKLVAQCIELVSDIPDVLPETIINNNRLLHKSAAITILHQPKSMEDLELAKRTLGFEEVFMLVLSSLILKQSIKTEKSSTIVYDPNVAQHFTSKLSFTLTDAQKKSAHAILQDLEKDQPMNRLLEGDVGSGKTMVAFMAVAMATKAGFQSALMVPTEILARQHFSGGKDFLKSIGVRADLLISDMPKPDRQKVLEDLKAGNIDCVIGTHALIAKEPEYANLGLVVIDEQHRFGVNQRIELKKKAKAMPHVLTMTATPIPRSLALVVYGDLDVSIIDELPPGRKPITTKLVEERDRVHVYAHVDSLIGQGQQAYVVCPLIAPSDKLGVKSVEAEFEQLQKTVFKHRRIGMVHGRLKAEEKAEVMQQFKDGKLDMLLATSVIEVGVDVPNATIMLIEGAERFGLAALHQLRGRVGRGKEQSHCYLFTTSDNPQTLKRLRALEKTTDGFRLAQIDLEIRGPGEIYGTAQHGILDLRIADLFDTKLLSEVKQAAESFLKDHNLLEYKQLVKHVNLLKTITTLD